MTNRIAVTTVFVGGHDLPEPLAPLAFILRMRTVPLRNLGACISPDNAWQFLQGIETLPLRMERHCENSLAVAKHLKNHDSVEWVRFPGLESDPMYSLNEKYLKGKGGSMVVFGIKGGAEAGPKFIDNLKLFSHLANVGDAKSLAIHPATTTHSQLNEEQQRAGGIPPKWFVCLSESNILTIFFPTSIKPLLPVLNPSNQWA